MKQLLERALEQAEKVIDQLQGTEMDKPTPCSEWNMRQLLNHIYNELAWVPELLAGKTIAQVGTALDGDLVGDDLHKTWHGYVAAVRTAVSNAAPHTAVHLSYGTVPAEQYLHELATDITVHTWDVATAAGIAYHIPEPLAEAVYDHIKNNIGEWRRAGLVAAAKPVAATATAEERLVALFGR
jgi:uncharacterized protein (TIGR03086 family)